VNVLPFEGRTHREVERLLPWYANATLEPVEHALVHAHLSECAQCRADLAVLRAQLDAIDEDAPAHDARATDDDWHRLRNRLHAQRQAATRSPWQRARSGWRTAAPWMRVAVAAQLAVVAVLGAFVASESLLEPAPQPEYRTLSAAPAAAVSNDDTLLVVFDPRLTDAQLRELLGANHARIVDGPNTAGAFLVAAPEGQADLVRNALRASPGVAMAERLAPPPGKAESR
jgi:hypothetical protein